MCNCDDVLLTAAIFLMLSAAILSALFMTGPSKACFTLSPIIFMLGITNELITCVQDNIYETISGKYN